jgi:hypothetical protein
MERGIAQGERGAALEHVRFQSRIPD